MAIRTTSVPRCPVCDGEGPIIHAGARDAAFGTPGAWMFRCCDSCRSFWLDPRPVNEDLHLTYERYYTHGTEQPSTTEARTTDRPAGGLLRRILEFSRASHRACALGYGDAGIAERASAAILRLWPGGRAVAEFEILSLPAVPGGRLLDVGTGDGHAVVVAAGLGWRSEGIDTDQRAIAGAVAKGIPARVASIADLASEAGEFDAITLRHVLEHLDDVTTTLRDAHALLRPGGRLAIATPNSRSMLHRRFGTTWRGLEPPRHLQIFSRRGLAQVVEAAGFVIERAETSVRGAHALYNESSAARRGRAGSGSVARVRGEMVQLVEALVRLFDHEAGEELLVVARR